MDEHPGFHLILDTGTISPGDTEGQVRLVLGTPNGQLVLTAPQRVADELAAAIILGRGPGQVGA